MNSIVKKQIVWYTTCAMMRLKSEVENVSIYLDFKLSNISK